MNEELERLDATAQAALVEGGEVTALELVDAAIERITRLEPTINALSCCGFDAARERAKTNPTGPFGGVPVLVKDLIAYPGMRHAMGSRLFAGNVPQEGTAYSEALDAAGVVVLGKTTTSELGMLGSTETLLDGVTHNPWDVSRSAGGSSGGSAAAVASGMVALAHASDGGGSIRIPASMTGLFGFKPGGDRIRPSAPHDMNGLLVDHCVSRSVRDSARLFALTERQADPRVGFVAGPSDRRLRIGFYEETLVGAPPSEDSRRVLERTVALCEELGHEVRRLDRPPVDGHALSHAFFAVAGATLSQVASMMQPMIGRPVGDGDFEPFSLELMRWFVEQPEDTVPKAMATFERLQMEMARYLEQVDVTLCPTIPVAPWEIGTLAPTLDRGLLIERTETLAGYTPIHNIAKMPAMSVPLFTTEEGLPIGSHFAASRGDDAMLFALAYELEAAAPWRDRSPSS